MIVICLLLGCLMVAGGVTAVTTGMGIIVLERGWSMVISGSVVATGGAILIGIALLIREVRRLPMQIASVEQEEWEAAEAEGRPRHLAHHPHPQAAGAEPPPREVPTPAEPAVAAAPASAIAAAAVAAAFETRAPAREEPEAASDAPVAPARTAAGSRDLDQALASVEQALAANFDFGGPAPKAEEPGTPKAPDFAFGAWRDRSDTPERPEMAPDMPRGSDLETPPVEQPVSEAPASAEPEPAHSSWFSGRFSRRSAPGPEPAEEHEPAASAPELADEISTFTSEVEPAPAAAEEPATAESAEDLRAERSDAPPAAAERTPEQQAAIERKARWSLFRRRTDSADSQETEEERTARIAAAALAVTPKAAVSEEERRTPDFNFDLSGLRRGDERISEPRMRAEPPFVAEHPATDVEAPASMAEAAEEPEVAASQEPASEEPAEPAREPSAAADRIDEDFFFAGISRQETVEAEPATEAAPQDESETTDLAVEEEPPASEFIPDPVPTVVGTYSAGGNLYVMFSDGSIEAETSRGTFRFSSLDELKAYVAASEQGNSPEEQEQQEAAPADDEAQLEPEGTTPWTTPKANP
jgi:hypothetical protein